MSEEAIVFHEPDDPRPEASLEGDQTLIIDDQDRYGRLRLIPWWRQEKLAAAKVLVVGAGALGNEVLKNLALLGVGTTYVIDRDTVETSNLSRSVLFRAEDSGRFKSEVAAARAAELNPEVAFHPIRGDILTDVGLGLFADCDVMIGCLDNREARLWVNRQCWKVGRPWIDAGIQEIQGVVKVFTPPKSACYECAMTAKDYELLNLRYSCPLLRREDLLAGKVPTAPTIASMMAGLQVQEALKLIHGMPVDAGCALVFNGVSNQFYRTALPFREDCLSHESYAGYRGVAVGASSRASEVLTIARKELEGPLSLVLDRDLVIALDCARCGWRQPVMRARSLVRQEEAICPKCRQAAHPETVSVVEEGSELADRPLAELGIPPYDIVRIDGARETGFYLMNSDASTWMKRG